MVFLFVIFLGTLFLFLGIVGVDIVLGLLPFFEAIGIAMLAYQGRIGWDNLTFLDNDLVEGKVC